MTPALRVAAAGLLTTIQDLGRFGYQHLGVPVGGALDTESLRAANALVGNPPGTAAIEAAHVGPTLVAEADNIRVAMVGARSAEILPDETAARGIPVEPLQSFCLRRGEALRLGPLVDGLVAYVAVEGGFAIAPVLGSHSTCIRGGFGGFHGRALMTDDVLPLRLPRASRRGEVRLEGFDFTPPRRIRVIPGPQADYFSDDEIEAFFDSVYIVGPNMNRMGMGLSGRPIHHARGFDIPSDAVAAGSIQIPGNGQPIVLLADRQTTGGYPKIATVISADVPVLGRFAPGAKIAFEPVTVETAEWERRQRFASLAALPNRLVPVSATSADVTANLSTCNLISGIVDIAA